MLWRANLGFRFMHFLFSIGFQNLGSAFSVFKDIHVLWGQHCMDLYAVFGFATTVLQRIDHALTTETHLRRQYMVVLH